MILGGDRVASRVLTMVRTMIKISAANADGKNQSNAGRQRSDHRFEGIAHIFYVDTG